MYLGPKQDDPWVSCPYDKVHRVPQSRIQAHIVKCQKRYPPLEICPYNATHRMSAEELKKHLVNCPAKLAMFPSEIEPKKCGDISHPKPIMQKDYLPEDDPENEYWD